MTTGLVAAILSSCAIAEVSGAEWHDGLYLGNGGYWRQRVRVEIRNDTGRDVAGMPVEVRIGRGGGQADLGNARLESLRICDAKGTEMLFSILDRSGKLVAKGAIPEGGQLILPVECPTGRTATYFVYSDNPAAWGVSDFLDVSIGVRNGGLEAGTGEVPAGWRHDVGDNEHRAVWVSENPHSGKRCLKTVVTEGGQPTWIATRQGSIRIVGGATYEMHAWVKAENVKGFAGWYIHVGTRDKPMMIAPMLRAGDGTFGWKRVSATFTAPEGADRADLGTVLRGTGVAWFDDLTLEPKTPTKLTATPARPEKLLLEQLGDASTWYDDNPADDISWAYRVPVSVRNLSDRPTGATFISVDLFVLMARVRRRISENTIRVSEGSRLVQHYRVGRWLLFKSNVPAKTVRTYFVYLSGDDRIKPTAGSDYAALLAGSRNHVNNPSFERGHPVPDNWHGGAKKERLPGTTMSVDKGGLFGEQCAKTHFPNGAGKAWTGWRQDVPVEPGKTYLYSAWLKTAEIADGSVRLHAHYRNSAGGLCEIKKFANAGPQLEGTTDWTLLSGLFTMPADAATFQLHLTMFARGTVWHDGVLLAEMTPGTVGVAESRAAGRISGLTVWPVNAVVKVFQENLPPESIPPARIAAARNEAEPLQLAIRNTEALRSVQVKVDSPVNAQGGRLTKIDHLTNIDVAVVGYVPIDHKTSYYRADSPAWHRKYPTRPGNCDGWAGMWPDPLLPRNTFDLPPNTTQPIWITVHVPKNAAAGDYSGKVRLVHRQKTVKEVPFTVHVWNFSLPDENHLTAVYDLRLQEPWNLPGKTGDEVRDQFWRFMAERRVCPNRIMPDPAIKYENGKVVADFTEFDKAAEYYFNELKLNHTYTPWYFYLFGWGHPPRKVFGQQPYEGQYPYEGVDHSKLRDKYKRAYQACLKAYWDHMKEKGWADKCLLYISDEPYDRLPHIRTQMKALCEMVHEVDPAIPIYCSTWRHVPDWDGYLNVWGIGHYGVVPPTRMQQLRKDGARLWFTTDGQMCTDTPYCGIERLLPHYCFQYGVEAYEFWGISWLTYDPYEYGWHRYIHQSGEPGESFWVRYPNGDGFLAYPGAPIGHDGPVTSIRLEQAREGMEDYEYLHLLHELVAKAKAAGKETGPAEQALNMAKRLVEIPNAGGRYSTRILPDPDAVLKVKTAAAKAIEGLQN